LESLQRHERSQQETAEIIARYNAQYHPAEVAAEQEENPEPLQEVVTDRTVRHDNKLSS